MGHGYAGDGSQYPAKVTLVDDVDLSPVVAAVLNCGPQTLADRTAFLAAQVGPVIAENWQSPPISLASGSYSHCKPSFDAVHGLWLVGESSGSDIDIRTLQGLVGSKSNVAGIIGTSIAWLGPVGSVLKDPTDTNTFYLAAYDVGKVNVWRLDLSTDEYTLVLALAFGSDVVTDAQLACFNGAVVLCYADQTQPSKSAIQVSENQGTTWQPPIPFDCLSSFSIAQSSTQLLVVANSLQSTGRPAAMTSLDGLTFAPQSFGDSVASRDVGIDVVATRDAIGPNFLFCFRRGTDRHFQRSADGSTWTDVGTTLTLTPLWSLAAIGPTVVGLTVDTAGAVGTQIVYSVDGGQSWFLSQFAAQNFNTSLLKVAANGAQFAAVFQDVSGNFSNVLFSRLQSARLVRAM